MENKLSQEEINKLNLEDLDKLAEKTGISISQQDFLKCEKAGEPGLKLLYFYMLNFDKTKKEQVIKLKHLPDKPIITLVNNNFSDKKGKKEVMSPEIQEKFKNPNLLEEIKTELSKTHIGDDNLKMTTFLTCTSGLLKNPKRRVSQALKGDTSTGKDNDFNTSLKHMPRTSFIFLTSGTQATLEDDIADKRIIAFSEVNKNREEGANKHLTEVIKQKAEGGTASMKKDKRTDMKTFRYDKTEQASVLYGTTESESDEELGTRFITGTIKTDVQRIKAVNDNTFETFSDINKLLEENSEEDSWIRQGLNYFFKKEEQYEVFIPYAVYLKEQIEGQDIFDNSNPRSQRDLKRLLSLTCAMTYLFQEQRKKIEVGDQIFLISEPIDFINTLIISSEFFNQSYSGLDARLTDVLDVMKQLSNINELGQIWIARDSIQEKLDVSRTTIKNYCETLAGEGLIEGIKGANLNQICNTNIYNGNKIYYKRCQKATKKPLIRVEVFKLKEYLESKSPHKLLENTTNMPILDETSAFKLAPSETSAFLVASSDELAPSLAPFDKGKLAPSENKSEFDDELKRALDG